LVLCGLVLVVGCGGDAERADRDTGIIHLPNSEEDRLKLALKAADDPMTEEAGCVPARIRGVPTSVGPPAPRLISAKRKGDDIKITYRFDPLPESLACKPVFITAVVSVGKARTASFQSYAHDRRIRSLRGTAVVHPPVGTKPPYTVRIAGIAIRGARSPFAGTVVP
jgi:hypothetical protein